MIYVPLAVVGELAIADRAGRVRLRQSVPQLFSNPAFAPYALSLDQIYTAAALGFNREPFDALIVSAAVLLELPLMTREAEIIESGAVRVIW